MHQTNSNSTINDSVCIIYVNKHYLLNGESEARQASGGKKYLKSVAFPQAKTLLFLNSPCFPIFPTCLNLFENMESNKF